MGIIKTLDDNNDLRRDGLKELQGKIELHINEIIVASRGIMKTEWERIKKGEIIYQKTKNAAKWGGVVLFFILLTLGIHIEISTYKANNNLQSRAEVLVPVAKSTSLASTPPQISPSKNADNQ
jgi:hypothetical protein